MSSNMKAVLVKDGASQDASGLYIGEVPKPTLNAGEVLVRIKAFGLNRMDIMQRRGNYPLPPGAGDILGVEFSGIVEDANGTSWKEGDEVFGLARGGAYSQYINIREKMIVKKPENVSFVEAAGILENYMTAYQTLITIAEGKKGQKVLVHAGASGVGLAAIQIAKNAGFEKIIATVGSQEKVDFVKQYATDVINYKTQDFAKEVEKITEGKGVNIVLDFVGKDYWEKNLQSLAIDGRLVLIGLLSGPVTDKPVNLGVLLYKRLRVEGTALRARSNEYQENLLHNLMSSNLLKGACKIIIHKTYSWKDIVEAHKDMEDAKNIGKLVCVVD